MQPSQRHLPLFIAEASEQLEALASELVRIEQEPAGTPLWDSIFRRVHSVKGGAATLGFSSMVEVAHASETLISRLKAKTGRPERSDVDLLLRATDLLVQEVRKAAAELQRRERGESTPDSLIERLAQAASALPDPAQAAAAKIAAPAAPAPEADPALPRLDVSVTLAKGCAAPGARALIVQRKLKGLGALLEMEPTPAQLMSQKGGVRLVALLATGKGPDEVKKALSGLPEVEAVDVRAKPSTATPTATPSANSTATATPNATSTTPTVTSAQTSPKDAEDARAEATVRVRAEALDQLLDQASDVLHGIARLRDAAQKLPEAYARSFEAAVDRLRLAARDLHGRVMNARLTPFSSLTERLPRAVRELSHRLGKEVDLEVQGADVELDRTVIEAMADPVIHLVRNAVDHGLEPAPARLKAGKSVRGKLIVAARRERDKVYVDIQDDGRGLDAEGLRRKAVASGVLTEEKAKALVEEAVYELAFLPGISTRAEATEISGRGVGLDVVKGAVGSLGGKVTLRSAAGKGAKFTLELPLSVSMANLLLVQVGGELYGVPMARVVLTTEYDLSARGGEGYEARSLVVLGSLVRAYGLAKLLGLPSLAPPGPRPFVVLEVDGIRFALAVDRLVGQEEAVLKPLFPPLDRLRGLAGTTVLGTGRALLVLDPRGLAELCGVHETAPVPGLTRGAA